MPRIPFLQPTFLVTSTRRNITFGDCLPSAVGKPADVRLPDPLRSRVSAFAEEDAGPPRGHPASDSRALDGALPASGPFDCRPGALSRGRKRALLPCRPSNGSVERNPLTPLSGRLAGRAAGATRCLPPEPVPAGARQCCRPFRARGAFHPKRPRERSCESPTRSAATLAGGAAAARFHRCSRTPTRPLGRSLS